MKLKVGDDGELDFIEVEEKPKRKRKSRPRGSLQGCGRLLFLMIILVLSVIGGFAAHFVINPLRGTDPRNTSCTNNIKTLSMAGGAALFLNSNGPRRTLISLDGKSFQTIDRAGEVDSLSLANDQKHVAESRREPAAPYSFIYTWVIDDFARWDEHIVTYGKYPA